MIEAELRKKLLVVLTGPSGSGKTTLIQELLGACPVLTGKVITTTTRSPRPGESQGIHYDFMSPEDFQAGVEAGEFLEHQRPYGHRYGTRWSRVLQVFENCPVALLTLDPIGALDLKKTYRRTGLTTIFIEPGSSSELAGRLTKRGDDPAKLEARVAAAQGEMALADQFDFRVVNGDGDQGIKLAKLRIIAHIHHIYSRLG